MSDRGRPRLVVATRVASICGKPLRLATVRVAVNCSP